MRQVAAGTSLFTRATIGVVPATLLVLALCVSASPQAWADGDPASDVLLGQSVFYPYQPPVSAKLEGALNSLLRAVSRARMPLKVAIIGSQLELGSVPEYYGLPQPYAKFLDREISFNRPEPLLVVMPAGFGLAHAGPSSALRNLTVDARQGTYGLTRTAILAVIALARANGHPVPVPSIPPPTPAAHGALPVALLFGLPVALLIAAGLTTLRGRTQRGQQ